jgi:hypothetical protein
MFPFFSRSVYKDHRFLESDPASWPARQSFMARPTKERVTRHILITAMHYPDHGDALHNLTSELMKELAHLLAYLPALRVGRPAAA